MIAVVVMYLYLVSIVIRAIQLAPGSDPCAGSLLRPPRLGALSALPQHPVRALADLIAVVCAGAAGGAAGALLEARPRTGQAGGRHAARAAAPLAERRERRRVTGVAGGASARDVERGGPRVVPVGRLGVGLGTVGASLVEHLGDVGAVP